MRRGTGGPRPKISPVSHASAGPIWIYVLWELSPIFRLERLLADSPVWSLRFGRSSRRSRRATLQHAPGIQQVRKESARSAMTASGDLDGGGVLGLVRHPWYVTVLILLWTGGRRIRFCISTSIPIFSQLFQS